MVNMSQFSNSWDKIKGEVKIHWGQLTDDDLLKVEGKKDKLVALIKDKYGYTKAKAEKEMDQFLEKINDSMQHSSFADALRHAGDGVQGFTHRLAEKSEHLNHKAHDKFDENYDQAINYIKKNPLKSTLIGVGAGLLLGKLFKL